MQYHINSPNENERLESLYSFSFLDDFQCLGMKKYLIIKKCEYGYHPNAVLNCNTSFLIVWSLICFQRNSRELPGPIQSKDSIQSDIILLTIFKAIYWHNIILDINTKLAPSRMNRISVHQRWERGKPHITQGYVPVREYEALSWISLLWCTTTKATNKPILPARLGSSQNRAMQAKFFERVGKTLFYEVVWRIWRNLGRSFMISPGTQQ